MVKLAAIESLRVFVNSSTGMEHNGMFLSDGMFSRADTLCRSDSALLEGMQDDAKMTDIDKQMFTVTYLSKDDSNVRV
jgi:hypothetical protein